MDKVRADEKKHKEKQEKTKKMQRDTESEMRYAKLKGKSISQSEALVKVRSFQQKRGNFFTILVKKQLNISMSLGREEKIQDANFGDNVVTLRHKKRKVGCLILMPDISGSSFFVLLFRNTTSARELYN